MQADYRNDRDHPSLSRGRALAQTSLEDASALHPGRASYGACRILESTGAGGLTDFTFGATTTGEAWSVNPYAGCQHACTYCYVPDTIHAERPNWGSKVLVKKDLPTRLAKAMARSERMTVYLSTATDPYQPVEAEHRVTRKCLQVLLRRDWPVELLTRSPLILRDLDLLEQFSQVRVGFSIPTLDDGLRRLLEPNAPAIASRLRALRKVSDAGIPTFANYTPATPVMPMPATASHPAGPAASTATSTPTSAPASTANSTGHEDAVGGSSPAQAAAGIANSFLRAGAQWVNSKGLQRKDTTLGPLYERLYQTPYEWVARFFASAPAQEEWHQELGRAFRKVGLPLSTPFFNAPFEHLAQPLPAANRQVSLEEAAEHRPPLDLPPLVVRRPKPAVARPAR